MEFQKIMHEWKRMCAATSFCEVCPLKDEKCWATSPANMVGDSKSIEAIIVAWAEEHPEPVYPTWYEYLFNVTRGENKWPVDDHEFCQWLDTTRIPPDIAQKLGIEPKEGA